MDGYLGETQMSEAEPFKDFGAADWAMYYIGRYGQIDGDWHKAWLLDAVSQILQGTPVSISLARWANGTEEYRVRLGEPSSEYVAWRAEMEASGGYDEGIGP